MFIKEVITSCFRYLRYSTSSFVITLNSCKSRSWTLLRAELVQKSPSIISPALLLTQTSWIMSARQPPRSPPLPSVEFSKELICWYWSQTGEGRQGDERHKEGLPDGWVMMMRGEWRNGTCLTSLLLHFLSSPPLLSLYLAEFASHIYSISSSFAHHSLFSLSLHFPCNHTAWVFSSVR